MKSGTVKSEGMAIEAIADVLADVIYEQLVDLGDDIKGVTWLSIMSDEHQQLELPLAA